MIMWTMTRLVSIHRCWIYNLDKMKTRSLEFFHSKIDKLITLAQSYTEVDQLGFIIRSCRLKPYSYVFEGQRRKIVLHRQWFDEFGNSLHFSKGKKIHITYGDLSVDRSKIVCTDLYYGLSLPRVARMSRLAYLCAGKDEDQYRDCFLLTFLGLDNYLRSYLYWYGTWQHVSPLTMGIRHLKLLINNADIKQFRSLTNSENLPIPCVAGRTWLTYLPSSQDFLNVIGKHYEILLPIFENK